MYLFFLYRFKINKSHSPSNRSRCSNKNYSFNLTSWTAGLSDLLASRSFLLTLSSRRVIKRNQKNTLSLVHDCHVVRCACDDILQWVNSPCTALALFHWVLAGWTNYWRCGYNVRKADFVFHLFPLNSSANLFVSFPSLFQNIKSVYINNLSMVNNTYLKLRQYNCKSLF